MVTIMNISKKSKNLFFRLMQSEDTDCDNNLIKWKHIFQIDANPPATEFSWLFNVSQLIKSHHSPSSLYHDYTFVILLVHHCVILHQAWNETILCFFGPGWETSFFYITLNHIKKTNNAKQFQSEAPKFVLRNIYWFLISNHFVFSLILYQ